MQTEVLTPKSAAGSVAGILERMPDGIVVLDARHDAVWGNRVAAAMLGGAATPAEVPMALRRLADGDSSEVELPSRRLLEARAVSIEWEGAPARLIVLRDVTDRLRAQASLVVATEELRSANARLQMLADVDPLTGLLNRRGLDRMLETELLPRARMGRDLVAIMVDCDGFKVVNDTFDHVAGDLVLRQVAERIRSAVRPQDLVARVGGDEFLVLLAGARQADALRVANRIRESVAASRVPVPFRQSEIALTVSVGVAQIPRHARNADDIVARADARLRQSKLLGKNRVTGPADVSAAAASD
jgi:diguanylate cyclase (GGDEF)-like protein